MSTPAVSVLMPIGRIDDYIAPAVCSILQQQQVDVELIVAGPRESSEDFATLATLLSEHFGDDSRIVCIARTNPGIAGALNNAMTRASCDYIARMDADDIAEPMRLVQQLELAKRHDNACLVSTCVDIFSSDRSIQRGNQLYQRWLNEQQSANAIRTSCFVESPLPHPTWLAHKNIWQRVGSYQQGDFPEDYDFVLRAWLLKIPMIKPKDLLLHWREHESRLTRTDTRYRREAFTQCKAKTLVNPMSGLNLHEGRRVWIAGTGRNARYWHDALVSNNAEVAGFVDLDGPNAKQQKRHKPVISYQQLANQQKNDLLVTAITAPDARNQLQIWCAEQGLHLGTDVVLGG